MGTLTINGVQHDWNKELELFFEEGFGVHAVVVMSENDPHNAGETFHKRNLTEFHHLYNAGRGDKPQSAFESDIHGTGGTLYLYRMESITITDETQKAESYYAE